MAPTATQDIPPRLAARWLAHANALSDAAEQFAADAADLPNAQWRNRLQSYADALSKAAGEVPVAKLRDMAAPTPPPAPATPKADPSLFVNAGFTRSVERTTVEQPLRVLLEEINKYGPALSALVQSLRTHPAAKFADYAPQVLEAVYATSWPETCAARGRFSTPARS